MLKTYICDEKIFKIVNHNGFLDSARNEEAIGI